MCGNYGRKRAGNSRLGKGGIHSDFDQEPGRMGSRRLKFLIDETGEAAGRRISIKEARGWQTPNDVAASIDGT